MRWIEYYAEVTDRRGNVSYRHPRRKKGSIHVIPESCSLTKATLIARQNKEYAHFQILEGTRISKGGKKLSRNFSPDERNWANRYDGYLQVKLVRELRARRHNPSLSRGIVSGYDLSNVPTAAFYVGGQSA